MIRPALALLLACLSAGSAGAADLSARAAYTVSLTEAAGRYSLKLDAAISGLAQSVLGSGLRASSAGAPTATGLAAAAFDLALRVGETTYSSQVSYAGSGEVTAFKVTPPIVNTIDRVPIERSQLTGVTDMLAAFVLRGPRLDAGLCNRRVQVFSGIERFSVALRYGRADTATSRRTAYQGPVIVCGIDYTPVSGHYTSSEITRLLAAHDNMLIWYAPLRGTGYFIPYRVLINTEAGDLSMVLTELE
jgi:hypothetical protein